MNTNDTIRRAMMRTPQPELPASFTPQLMVRVRRRSCLRTLLHNAALTAVAILVVAAAIAAMVLFLPQSSLRQPSPTAVYDLKPEPLSQTFKNLLPSMPELPKLPGRIISAQELYSAPAPRKTRRTFRWRRCGTSALP